MARRQHIRTLRRILDVRAAEQAAAEMHLGRIARDRLTLQRRESQVSARQDQEIAAWSTALAAGSLDLPLVGAWAAAVYTSRRDLHQLSLRLDANETDRNLGRADLAAALARVEVAQELLTADQKRQRAAAEEAQLNALADRFAHQGKPR